jgi:hypothetical protein
MEYEKKGLRWKNNDKEDENEIATGAFLVMCGDRSEKLCPKHCPHRERDEEKSMCVCVITILGREKRTEMITNNRT